MRAHAVLFFAVVMTLTVGGLTLLVFLAGAHP